MIGHVGVTVIAVGAGFWQSSMMRHGFKRACLFVLLVVALTVGQVPAAGHAGTMAPDAEATMAMDGSASAPCDTCDCMADPDDGAACALPCPNAGPALPVAAPPLQTRIGLCFAPVAWSRLPDGRTIPPEPDPPRAFA